MKRARVAVIVACSVAHAVVARAQPSQRAVAAEELFDSGRELLKQHRYREACEKLDASQKLDPAVGTLLSLGECYLGQGRTAAAWFAYRAAGALAAQRGDFRRAAAEQRASSLVPRLSTLVVHRPIAAAAPGETILVDGEPFSADALREPIVVDPGRHRVEASAPDRRPWRQEVDVGADAESVVVDVPPLEPAAAAAAPIESHAARRNVGIAIGAVGLTTIAVGAVLGVHAIVKGHDASQVCPTAGACPSEGAVHDNDVAKTYADASTIAIPIGVVLTAAGAWLFATSRAHRAPELTATATAQGARATVGWSW